MMPNILWWAYGLTIGAVREFLRHGVVVSTDMRWLILNPDGQCQ
jgi:hypothetical protein